MTKHRNTPQEWALLATVVGHVVVIVLVAAGTFVLGEKVPTGFLALATLALGQLCPKCMAAVLQNRPRTPKTAKDTEHGH